MSRQDRPIEGTSLRAFSASLCAALALACMAGCEAPAQKKDVTSAATPASQWISVKNVQEEYAYIAAQKCLCGGGYERVSQATGEEGGRHFDKVFSRCTKCGTERVFTFDASTIFEEYDLADSKEAQAAAYNALNRRYPQVSPAQVPELARLLDHQNPHYRAWASERLAEAPTPAAIDALLAAYLKAGILGGMPMEDALARIGAPAIPAARARLAGNSADARSNVLHLLAQIRQSASREAIEGELRSGPAANRRKCYIALGELAYKESEPLLLECLKQEAADPDDALIWALGCCGTERGAAAIRPYLGAADKEVRMAAIAAAGLVGDHESMPALLKLAAEGKDHNTRYNAIYALGQLKAREAVPLLVVILSEPPHYGNGFYCPLGIYGKDGGLTTQVSLVEVAVRAAARIADERAMPAFEALLRNDGYYLDHDTVAEAAAELGWKQLVPAIIDRLAKDHAENLKLFGPAHEEYSAALRRLTGQTFGEDPKAWQEWLKQQNP